MNLAGRLEGLGKRTLRFRQPIVFGLAAAVSRAGGILAVPLAAQALSLEALGYYAICIALIQLLCQLLSLGGSVAVSQTGAQSVLRARALAARFAAVALSLGAFVLAVGVLTGLQFGAVVGLVAMISALEAHQQLFQLVIRAQEREVLFLWTSILKAFAWPISLLVYVFMVHRGRADIPIETILLFQLGVYVGVSGVFEVIVRYGSSVIGSPAADLDFRGAVVLSLPMVLHAFSQWVMSSSDRIILARLADEATLAFYSLAYSLASIMFVIVSAMALYLPHEIMKRVDLWGGPAFRLRFIRFYVLVYTALFSLLACAYAFDYTVTNVLRYRNADMFWILGIVGSAFLFTGVYHLYVPFLFAAGRTRAVTAQTLKACLLYAVAIIPLIHYGGGIGAAIGTFLVWAYYLVAIRRQAILWLAERGIGDDHRSNEFVAIAAGAASCLVVAGILFMVIPG